MNQTSVSTIIACFERAEELQRLLISLKKMGLSEPWEIIVVDDGSKNHQAIKQVTDEFQCSLIRLDKNVGPAVARNLGVKNAKGKFLWFLDSDTEVNNPHLLETMVRCLKEDQSLAGVGGEAVRINGKIYSISLHPLPNWLPLTKHIDSEKSFKLRPKFISTNNLLVSKKDFLAVGGFNHYFDMCEDQDLCLKLASKGKKFLVRNDTLVIHHHSSSGRQGGKFWFFDNTWNYTLNMHKSRVKILSLHFPPLLPLLPLFDLFCSPVVLVWQAFFTKRRGNDLLEEKSESSSVRFPVFIFFNLIAMFSAWLIAGKLIINSLIEKK